MTLKRIEEYPTKQHLESLEGYVKRLRDRLQEESSEIRDEIDWTDTTEALTTTGIITGKTFKSSHTTPAFTWQESGTSRASAQYAGATNRFRLYTTNAAGTLTGRIDVKGEQDAGEIAITGDTAITGDLSCTNTGIADDDFVQIDDADAADNDYCKLTTNGIEGRSYSEVRTDLIIDNFNDVRRYADFATAISTIGATQTTLIISNQQNVTTDETVPATMTLKFLNGGTLNISNTKTVTINGDVRAGLYQIFEGAGEVAFGAGVVREVYPEWWGVDGTADDVQINAAIASIVRGTVKLQPTTYSTTASVDLDKSGIQLQCNSLYATLTTATDIDCITVSEQDACLTNIKVIKTGAASTKAGIHLGAKAELGRYTNVWATVFKYGFELEPTAVDDVLYNDFVACRTSGIIGACIYIHAAAGSANENHFFGGSHTATTAGRCVDISLGTTNQNTFTNVSFEGGSTTLFGIVDHGTNTFQGCRFEMDGNGFYVHNDSSNQRSGTRIFGTHWSRGAGKALIACVEGRLVTDTWFDEGSANGYVAGGDILNTTVNGDSASGQKVLNVASTTGLFEGSSIVLDESGSDEEWHVIDEVTTPGSVVTLKENLENTHTAADAHVVSSYGRFYGQISFPWEGSQYVHYFVYGERAFYTDSTNDFAYYDFKGLFNPGIGVGNSAAGDVTGTSKDYKVEIFDESGSSLGYLQVYAG